VSLVLPGDFDQGVEHDEGRSREEGILLRVQASDHGKVFILELCITDFVISFKINSYPRGKRGYAN
jgi:hypothetical protein